jgi:RecA-family ATPase
MPDWLGGVIDMPGPAIFFSAEEDDDEIHRRLDAILQQRGLSFRNLDHRLHVRCMPGEDVVLGAPNKLGVIQPTKLFNQLALAIEEKRPAVVVLEAAADVFAGNENDRVQVRQFIGHLRRPAISTGAAVMLIQHPSLTGLASGSGTSGSTAWNNSVRSRLNFTAAKPSDGDDPDPNLRELRVMKSNYGPSGEAVRLKWQRGVFVPEGSPSPLDRAAAEAPIDEAFLRCLDAATGQGRIVSHLTGRNYAPAAFEKMPEARGVKNRAFDLALSRLLSAHRIKIETDGPPSKARSKIVRV